MGESNWKLMFQVSEALRNFQQKHHPPEGKRPELTISQVRVLGSVFLSKCGQVKVKEIAEELDITSGGVSQIVDNLVKLNLLERTQDENDRRAVVIKLSPHGLEIHRQLDEDFTALYDELTRDVSREKQQVFAEVLNEMQKKMNQIKGK